jgi:hypothetical protein
VPEPRGWSRWDGGARHDANRLGKGGQRRKKSQGLVNVLEQLKVRLEMDLPGAQIALDIPLRKDAGVWWLDITRDDMHVVAECKPGRSEIGVSRLSDEADSFGTTAPDHTLGSVDAAAREIGELLRGKARPSLAAG